MNETFPSIQENHFKINTIPGLLELWRETLGNEKACIAIIDGNIDYNHLCFKGANISSIDIFNSASTLKTENFALQHGTGIASIILGQHHSMIQGVAPGCKGIIIPIFRHRENVPTACSQLDLARAIKIADQNGAHVINISGGEFSASGKSEVILAETIQSCVKKGILIISAAGNDGCECLHVPAAENSVLAIGAMDKEYKPLDFSNWGNTYKSNGILFPGKDILTAAPYDGVTVKTGTSFATPIASGISALLLSLMIKAGVKPDGRVVRNALLNTAIRCNKVNLKDCEKTLVGYLNLPGAIQEILDKCKHPSLKKERYDEIKSTTSKSIVFPSEFNIPSSWNLNLQYKTNSNNKKRRENYV